MMLSSRPATFTWSYHESCSNVHHCHEESIDVHLASVTNGSEPQPGRRPEPDRQPIRPSLGGPPEPLLVDPNLVPGYGPGPDGRAGRSRCSPPPDEGDHACGRR